MLRKLTLHKGGHRFVFRWEAGREWEVAATFAELANNPESGFDWYDAAVASYQMGRHLEKNLAANQ